MGRVKENQTVMLAFFLDGAKRGDILPLQSRDVKVITVRGPIRAKRGEDPIDFKRREVWHTYRLSQKRTQWEADFRHTLDCKCSQPKPKKPKEDVGLRGWMPPKFGKDRQDSRRTQLNGA